MTPVTLVSILHFLQCSEGVTTTGLDVFFSSNGHSYFRILYGPILSNHFCHPFFFHNLGIIYELIVEGSCWFTCWSPCHILVLLTNQKKNESIWMSSNKHFWPVLSNHFDHLILPFFILVSFKSWSLMVLAGLLCNLFP